VGLKTLIFAANPQELESVLKLKPTYAAYEPPELVGSKTTSVAQANSEIIEIAVQTAKKAGVPLVVGAGIKDSQDVRKSLELGAVGVAVASDVVTANDPRQELLDLIEGFK
jgi:triosephosphate isomerase